MSSIHDIINQKCNDYDYTIQNTSSRSKYWYQEIMKKNLYGYLNKSVKISPQLHKLVYNEDIDPSKLIITDNIFDHIIHMHCHVDGFNSDDYDRLPNKFKRYTYQFIKNYSQSKTSTNLSIIITELCAKYNFPLNYAIVIAENWVNAKPKLRDYIIARL